MRENIYFRKYGQRHNASQSVTRSIKGYSRGVTKCHSVPLNERLWCRNASRQSHITHGCTHQAAMQRFITRHNASLPVPHPTTWWSRRNENPMFLRNIGICVARYSVSRCPSIGLNLLGWSKPNSQTCLFFVLFLVFV